MKAALVSATSLAALLAFEVGLDVAIDARPAKASSFISTPSSLFGYVLLNTSAQATSVTAAETVTNTHGSSITVTFPAVATSPFSGTSVQTVLAGHASVTQTYGLSLSAGTTISQSASVNTSIVSGSTTHAVTLSAQAVAPQQSTSGVANSSLGTLRVGTTVAAITVSNIGNGDLYSSTLAAAQLQVSLGASNSVFTPAANTFSLNDKNYTPGTGVSVTAANYVFSPSAHGVGQSTTATISFANGGSNNNGTTFSVVALTATGVGPVFKGVYNGATYTNATAVGTSVNNAGNVALGTQKHGATTTFTITLSNATNDTPSTLTGLKLNGFSLGTCTVLPCTNIDGFSILSFATTPLTIAEGSGSVTMTLDFSGGLQTYYNADLSFDTDQGAATGVGGTGAVFSYLLTANIPEPATIITFGMGLAGLGWARRRRAARRSAIGTDGSPA